MFSNVIFWSTAAIGGAPFRFNKCTALSSGIPGIVTGKQVGRAHV